MTWQYGSGHLRTRSNQLATIPIGADSLQELAFGQGSRGESTGQIVEKQAHGRTERYSKF